MTGDSQRKEVCKLRYYKLSVESKIKKAGTVLQLIIISHLANRTNATLKPGHLLITTNTQVSCRQNDAASTSNLQQ